MEKLQYFKELYTKALTNNKYGYAIEAYSPKTIAKIFKQNLPIYFKNAKYRDITVVDAYYGTRTGRAYIKWKFSDSKVIFNLPVDNFLKVYKSGEFHSLTPVTFANKYLITINNKLNKINYAIHKQDKTKSNEAKEMNNRKTAKHAHSSARNSFEDKLSKQEQAVLTGWILNHLYSIHLYGDINNPHHAYMYFNTLQDMPTELFTKMLNRSSETIFNNKRLNDTHFVKDFYDYTRSFMPYLVNGDKKIYKYIQPNAPEFEKQFGDYYDNFFEPFLPF